MLFLRFILSFLATLKNEIPGASLERCQLKIKQFSPDILKFRTRHKDNPFTLNCSMFRRTFLFIFHTYLLHVYSYDIFKWTIIGLDRKDLFRYMVWKDLKNPMYISCADNFTYIEKFMEEGFLYLVKVLVF